MSIILHGNVLSPAVRGVQLASEVLGVKYEFKTVNVMAGENRTPEYLKLNPLHTIPTIQDGDFTLYDSHAIVAYLADTYGKKDSFFPKDTKKRAIVNARLHYDNTYLFARFVDLVGPIFLKGESAFQPERLQRVQESLDILEVLLEGGLWVAGEGPTIADCSCAAVVESIKWLLPSSPLPPKVAAWLKRCEATLPKYETLNKQGAQALAKAVISTLEERAAKK